jgi:hypothetical protein
LKDSIPLFIIERKERIIMAKLYPPSIEGKLPAFAGESLKIPITMNRTVNINQVGSMRAMIKTVQTS